jgi:hypothetical protein
LSAFSGDPCAGVEIDVMQIRLWWRCTAHGGLLAGSILFGLQTHAAYASASVPDWVKTAAQQKLPEYPAKTRAVVLYEETTYTVAPDGRATEHVRRATKILRPSGRENALPVVWFDKDSKITSFKAWSIDPAGHEYEAKSDQIVDFGMPAEGGELYVDERAKVAKPSGMDPGGIVAYEYVQNERPYMAEGTWSFREEIPRLKQTYTLVLPPGYTYTTSWAHHAPVAGADLENASYRWEMNNEPAVDTEDIEMAPSLRALLGRMTVHYAGAGMKVPEVGTWQGVGQWYDLLAHDRETATPEITAEAVKLTNGKTDFYDKAEAIGEFVQKQIRYFVIERGIGGNQPHPAGDIFRSRYGDCKDKATLLSAMLASVGIHSDIVLVDTARGAIDSEAPSTEGNHAIAAIEIPHGYESPRLHSVVTAKTGRRYLIFDPTWTYTPFGQLEDNLQGSYGVLVEGAESQIVQLPVLDPLLNRVDRTAKFALSGDGTLTGSVTEDRFGDLAEYTRSMLQLADEKQREKYLNRVKGRDFSEASMTDFKAENVDALNKDLITSFHIEADHFASSVGPLLMVRPRVLGSLQLHVDRERRLVAVDLEQTMEAKDDFSIELPKGYAIDELPEPVKVDMGFASYQSSTVQEGQSLHYKRTYTVRQVTVPAEKYPEVRKLAALIEADEQSQAVLKRTP